MKFAAASSATAATPGGVPERKTRSCPSPNATASTTPTSGPESNVGRDRENVRVSRSSPRPPTSRRRPSRRRLPRARTRKRSNGVSPAPSRRRLIEGHPVPSVALARPRVVDAQRHLFVRRRERDRRASRVRVRGDGRRSENFAVSPPRRRRWPTRARRPRPNRPSRTHSSSPTSSQYRRHASDATFATRYASSNT